MELTVRLTPKDMTTSGVFAALEMLCTCFRPEEFGSITVDPDKGKKDAEPAPRMKEAEKKGAAAETAAPAAQPPTMTAPTAAIPQPPTASSAPTVQAQSTAPPTVPVAGPQSFTIPQVAQAAAVYAETSDTARQQICDLIHSYGVAALADIPQSKLGEFATQLRGMGARI